MLSVCVFMRESFERFSKQDRIVLARSFKLDCTSTHRLCCFCLFEPMQQGSGATGDCCSKCWNDFQKKQGIVAAVQPTESVSTKASVVQCLPTSEPTPMEVETVQREEVVEEIVAECTSDTPKKKKKASYKSMMASMLQSSSPSRDLEQEKESLRKVTGGGTFSKIDKI